jgi:hypothetical protein
MSITPLVDKMNVMAVAEIVSLRRTRNHETPEKVRLKDEG